MNAASVLIGAITFFTIVAAATLLRSGARHGDSPSDTHWIHDSQRLVAEGTADGDHFGYHVALDGNSALIGAPVSDAAAANSGGAYLIRFDGDVPAAKIGEHEATSFSEFGSCVALCRGIALVGSPGDDEAGEDAGAAYLYQDSGEGSWNRAAKLVADDAVAGEHFGNFVAMEKGTALIGTRGRHRSGAVYLFQEVASGNWRQVTKWTSAADTSDDCFGYSIDICGDLAVVGAQADGGKGQYEAGAAYLFERHATAGWRQVAKLTASRVKPHQFFGRAVAIVGETVAVGAPGDANYKGSVYVFRRDGAGTWQGVAQLTPRVEAARCHFGHDIAMSGGMIAVGAPVESDTSGAVYLFEEVGSGDWEQVARYALAGRRAHHWFGVSLALSGKTLLVGAHYGRGNTPKSGAAFLFHHRGE